MSGFLLGLRTSFGFLSTIPVGITMEGLDELVKRSYLQTLAGVVLGLMIGVFAFLSGSFLPSSISAILIMVFVYYLTGFNHLDGLADFGDGATAHGSLEKKIHALKDVSLGIGGVGYAGLVIVGLYASIISLQAEVNVFSDNAAFIVAICLVVAEIGSKQAMLTVAAFGKPIHEGLGSMVINGTTVPRYFAAFLLGLVVCAFFGSLGLIGYFASIITGLVVLNVSNRHFEGINGDCVGASNEVAKVIAMMDMAVTVMLINKGYRGLF